MSLPKKKSRPIRVEDIEYRYQISTSARKGENTSSLNLTIQRVGPRQDTLIIKGLVTSDFWLNFPNANVPGADDLPIITPHHIACIIQKAISMGWDSSYSGKVFTMNMNNQELRHLTN